MTGKRRRHAHQAAALLLLCALAPATTAWAAGKHKKDLPQIALDRVAKGQVVNASKQPLDGAVVYLEDPNSLSVKSYLSTTGGKFHFDHLQPETDYEVWAEQNGVESKHKFISQFNSHTTFDFTLQVPPPKHRFLGFL